MDTFLKRFWKRVLIDEPGKCWLWDGAPDGKGYGQIGKDGRLLRAHRVMWELMRGPIPEGLTIDHLCRNRLCVNPDHLEPVTMRENLMRGNGVGAMHARQTHCLRGHPLVPGNLRPGREGHRRCLECHRADNRLYWQRRRARTEAFGPIG